MPYQITPADIAADCLASLSGMDRTFARPQHYHWRSHKGERLVRLAIPYRPCFKDLPYGIHQKEIYIAGEKCLVRDYVPEEILDWLMQKGYLQKVRPTEMGNTDPDDWVLQESKLFTEGTT